MEEFFKSQMEVNKLLAENFKAIKQMFSMHERKFESITKRLAKVEKTIGALKNTK